MKKYKPQSKQELRALCENQEINLGDIDVSLIMDMSELFCKSYILEREDWSGIESWDVSFVLDMSKMFKGVLSFNHCIKSWNVSNYIYKNPS